MLFAILFTFHHGIRSIGDWTTKVVPSALSSTFPGSSGCSVRELRFSCVTVPDEAKVETIE